MKALRRSERLEIVHREVISEKRDVQELCDRLGVSPSTIRRDLADLAKRGLVTRTYGGAVSDVEPSLSEKNMKMREEKEAIARAALNEIQDGDTIFLDAGTTTGRLARHLRYRKNITVITNGLNSMASLVDNEDITLIVLGGGVRRPSQAIVGRDAENALGALTADRCFIGAEGIDAQFGLCARDPSLLSIKSLMITRCTFAYVLADHTKLGARPFHNWMKIERDLTIITDDHASHSIIAQFESTKHLIVRRAST